MYQSSYNFGQYVFFLYINLIGNILRSHMPAGAFLEQNIGGGNAPSNRGAESSGKRRRLRHRVGWCMGKDIPPQPRGLRSVVSSASAGSGTHFAVFWRPQNAPFCSYMLTLWVRRTVFGRQGRGLGQMPPAPTHRTAPACQYTVYSLRDVTHNHQ